MRFYLGEGYLNWFKEIWPQGITWELWEVVNRCEIVENGHAPFYGLLNECIFVVLTFYNLERLHKKKLSFISKP